MTSDRISVSLVEIETLWSIEDLFDAHVALDLHDELQRLVNQKGRET